MRTYFPKPAAGVLFALLMASPVLAANNGANGNSANAPGHDRVCLVTFNSESAVAAGRNVDVVGTKLLPRKAAQAQEGGASKIFEYGANTEQTCNCLNDPSTRATCG